MKKLLFLFLLVTINTFSQIEIDEVEEKKITPIPYNGEFMKLPYILEDEVGLGLIGEMVTLIDVERYDLKKSDGSNVSYSETDKFKNKTFTITDYKKDLYPIFTIKNDSGVFEWKVTYSSEYVFNKFIESIKEKLVNKVYIPLHNETNVEALNGSKITIEGSKEYKISNVSYTKFSSIEYGIKVELNELYTFKYPIGLFNQPVYHNGKENVPINGWINLENEFVSFTLIEKEIFKTFSSKNTNFLKEIRSRVVKIGMTEQQCRWAWGIPNSSLGSILGYNEVYDWGGKTLYFKNDKLALIK